MAIYPAPTFDSKARLLWREDMENYTTKKWYDFTGVSSYVNSVDAFERDYVLNVTNAGGTAFHIGRYMGLMKGKVSFEIHWIDALIYNWRLGISQYDGVMRYRGELTYTNFPVNNAGWAYTNSALNAVAIPALSGVVGPGGAPSSWQFVKLMVDFNTHKYMSASTFETNYNGIEIEADLMASVDATAKCTLFDIDANLYNIGGRMRFDDARIYAYE